MSIFAVIALASTSPIAFDIRDSRRQARKILHRGRKVYLSGIAAIGSAFNATVRGPTPSIEQRIDALETRTRQLDEQLTEMRQTLRQEMHNVAEKAAERALRSSKDDHSVLEEVLLISSMVGLVAASGARCSSG